MYQKLSDGTVLRAIIVQDIVHQGFNRKDSRVSTPAHSKQYLRGLSTESTKNEKHERKDTLERSDRFDRYDHLEPRRKRLSSPSELDIIRHIESEDDKSASRKSSASQAAQSRRSQSSNNSLKDDDKVKWIESEKFAFPNFGPNDPPAETSKRPASQFKKLDTLTVRAPANFHLQHSRITEREDEEDYTQTDLSKMQDHLPSEPLIRTEHEDFDSISSSSNDSFKYKLQKYHEHLKKNLVKLGTLDADPNIFDLNRSYSNEVMFRDLRKDLGMSKELESFKEIDTLKFSLKKFSTIGKQDEDERADFLSSISHMSRYSISRDHSGNLAGLMKLIRHDRSQYQDAQMTKEDAGKETPGSASLDKKENFLTETRGWPKNESLSGIEGSFTNSNRHRLSSAKEPSFAFSNRKESSLHVAPNSTDGIIPHPSHFKDKLMFPPNLSFDESSSNFFKESRKGSVDPKQSSGDKLSVGLSNVKKISNYGERSSISNKLLEKSSNDKISSRKYSDPGRLSTSEMNKDRSHDVREPSSELREEKERVVPGSLGEKLEKFSEIKNADRRSTNSVPEFGSGAKKDLIIEESKVRSLFEMLESKSPKSVIEDKKTQPQGPEEFRNALAALPTIEERIIEERIPSNPDSAAEKQSSIAISVRQTGDFKLIETKTKSSGMDSGQNQEPRQRIMSTDARLVEEKSHEADSGVDWNFNENIAEGQSASRLFPYPFKEYPAKGSPSDIYSPDSPEDQIMISSNLKVYTETSTATKQINFKGDRGETTPKNNTSNISNYSDVSSSIFSQKRLEPPSVFDDSNYRNSQPGSISNIRKTLLNITLNEPNKSGMSQDKSALAHEKSMNMQILESRPKSQPETFSFHGFTSSLVDPSILHIEKREILPEIQNDTDRSLNSMKESNSLFPKNGNGTKHDDQNEEKETTFVATFAKVPSQTSIKGDNNNNSSRQDEIRIPVYFTPDTKKEGLAHNFSPLSGSRLVKFHHMRDVSRECRRGRFEEKLLQQRAVVDISFSRNTNFESQSFASTIKDQGTSFQDLYISLEASQDPESSIILNKKFMKSIDEEYWPTSLKTMVLAEMICFLTEILLLLTIIWVLIPSLQNNDKVMTIYYYNQQVLTKISKAQLSSCILESEILSYSKLDRFINYGFSTCPANEIEINYLTNIQEYIIDAVKITQYDLSSLKEEGNAIDLFQTIIPVNHTEINSQTTYSDYVKQMGVELKNLAIDYDLMTLEDPVYKYVSLNSKSYALTAAYDRLESFRILKETTSDNNLGNVLSFYIVDIIFSGITVLFLIKVYRRVIEDKELIYKLLGNLPEEDLSECLKQSKKILDHIKHKAIKGKGNNQIDFYIPNEGITKAAVKNKHAKKYRSTKFMKIKVRLWPIFFPIFMFNTAVSIYSLVQIFTIRTVFKHVSDLEDSASQLARAEFSLNVAFAYMRRQITGETPLILIGKKTLNDFLASDMFYDFTSFYRIEDDTILDVDKQFYSIQDEFLVNKVCQQTHLAFICSDDVSGFNVKDALFHLKNLLVSIQAEAQAMDANIDLNLFFLRRDLVLTEMLVMITSERIDYIANKIVQLIHYKMLNLKDSLKSQQSYIVLIAIPFWLYVYFAFSRRIIGDTLQSKKFLKYIKSIWQ